MLPLGRLVVDEVGDQVPGYAEDANPAPGRDAHKPDLGGAGIGVLVVHDEGVGHHPHALLQRLRLRGRHGEGRLVRIDALRRGGPAPLLPCLHALGDVRREPGHPQRAVRVARRPVRVPFGVGAHAVMIEEPGRRLQVGEPVEVPLTGHAVFRRLPVRRPRRDVRDQLPRPHVEPGAAVDPVSRDVPGLRPRVVRVRRLLDLDRPVDGHPRKRVAARPEVDVRRRVRDVKGVVVGELRGAQVLLERIQPSGKLGLNPLSRPRDRVRVPQDLAGVPRHVGQHDLRLSVRGEVVRPEHHQAHLSAGVIRVRRDAAPGPHDLGVDLGLRLLPQ